MGSGAGVHPDAPAHAVLCAAVKRRVDCACDALISGPRGRPFTSHRTTVAELIVVPAHRSGLRLLENLLRSFRGYAKYPILVVINDHQPSDDRLFGEVLGRFSDLPIRVEALASNSFELGGLLVAMQRTDADEFFLLSHSCEIVDTALFDLVFEHHRGRSVACGLQEGDWRAAGGARGQHWKFISQFVDRAVHERLLALGKVMFWQAHIGKYRRAILETLPLEEHVPTNMLEAISLSELLFTSMYHAADPSTVVLFPDWVDGTVVEQRFGAARLRIANEYIIKWKTRWSVDMVLDDMYASRSPLRRMIRRVRAALRPRT